MSSTTSPHLGLGNDPPPSDLHVPSEASVVKKFKIEQSDTNKEKSILQTSVPSSAFLCRSTPRKKITFAPKFDYPSSAFKVSSPSVTSTTLCRGSTDGDLCGENKRRPVQSTMEVDEQDKLENQESQKSIEVEPEDAKEPSLAHCDEKQEHPVIQDNIPTNVDDVNLLSDGEQEIEVSKSQEEEEESLTHISEDGDSDTCTWENLPFFEFEEVDGFNNQLASEIEARKVAAKGGDDSCVVKRRCKKKHGEKSPKTGKEKERPKKLPPNAFVALRIPSPDIRAKVEEVQEALLAKDVRLKATFVSPAKNHITLIVLRIDHTVTEEIEKYEVLLL